MSQAYPGRVFEIKDGKRLYQIYYGTNQSSIVDTTRLDVVASYSEIFKYEASLVNTITSVRTEVRDGSLKDGNIVGYIVKKISDNAGASLDILDEKENILGRFQYRLKQKNLAEIKIYEEGELRVTFEQIKRKLKADQPGDEWVINFQSPTRIPHIVLIWIPLSYLDRLE